MVGLVGLARKPLPLLQVVPLAPKMVVGLPLAPGLDVDDALLVGLPLPLADALPSLLVRTPSRHHFLFELGGG